MFLNPEKIRTLARMCITPVLKKISIRYSTIETKEAARIGYNGFLFPHEYSGEGRGATSFVSIIMYLTCTMIVLLKKTNGIAFNPTTTQKVLN